MALFPTLKTNAVAQYPSKKTYDYSTEVMRFLDGSEQRYRRFSEAVQRWEISLELLDERELGAVTDFYSSQAGRFGSFEFFDPWDEVEYENCSFDNDDLPLALDGEGRARTKLTIRRNLV